MRRMTNGNQLPIGNLQQTATNERHLNYDRITIKKQQNGNENLMFIG